MSFETIKNMKKKEFRKLVKQKIEGKTLEKFVKTGSFKSKKSRA